MKLKLGTRVIVNGVETYITELHAGLERGVYAVRTSNPAYEFTKDANGNFKVITSEEGFGCYHILLKKAPKFGNYRVGDRVFDPYEGLGVVTEVSSSGLYPITVTYVSTDVESYTQAYTIEGLSKQGYVSKPLLKKLRVKQFNSGV